jgi:membrane protein implicated in regulation of membrane protease activity
MVADADPAGYAIGRPAVRSGEVYASAVDAWLVWLVVAVVLAIAEVLTLTFVLGMIAGGAALAAISAAIGVPVVAQVIVFGVGDGLLLGLVLPAARRHRHMPPSIRTGTARLVGTRAMALSDINTAEGGRVRIGGETWSARPYDEGLLIPAGEWVDVLAIDGATAVVHPTTLPGVGI